MPTLRPCYNCRMSRKCKLKKMIEEEIRESDFLVKVKSMVFDCSVLEREYPVGTSVIYWPDWSHEPMACEVVDTNRVGRWRLRYYPNVTGEDPEERLLMYDKTGRAYISFNAVKPSDMWKAEGKPPKSQREAVGRRSAKDGIY